jgi:dTDP-4-amino-4,6-dideoxygalactose transaminase
MKVPFIDLHRLAGEVRAEVLADWQECLDNCEFVGGPRVGRVEAALREILGVPRAVTCANGTDALVIGLHAMGVRHGMRVALPNLTFWATYEAIAQLGAVPVLVDVDSEDLQMSLTELGRAHEAHPLDAAILVHLFGWTSARLRDIRAFCAERRIRLLEDGAQGFGVTFDERPVLADADVGTLSFYPAKVIGGAMDGGAITMRAPEREAHVRSLCNHGRSDHYSYADVGWNSRMGGLQAAFLERVLARAGAIVAQRRAAVEAYRARLASAPRVKVWGPPPGVRENGYLCVVTVDGVPGKSIAEALQARGIGAGRTYPETLDIQPPAKHAVRVGDLRVSRAFTDAVVNLPLFYGITEQEISRSADALLEVVRTAGA